MEFYKIPFYTFQPTNLLFICFSIKNEFLKNFNNYDFHFHDLFSVFFLDNYLYLLHAYDTPPYFFVKSGPPRFCGSWNT
jgi:hypothetical protein